MICLWQLGTRLDEPANITKAAVTVTGLYPAFKYAKHKSAVIKFRMEMKDNSYSLVQSCPGIAFQVFGGKKTPNLFHMLLANA